MIISHKHRFIFVHIPKTAGTTVSVYLARHLGPLDIMIGSWGAAMAQGVRPNARTLFYAATRQSPVSIARALLKGRARNLLNSGLRSRFGREIWDHSSAAEIERFDPDAWRSYFKFCFVRNPFDRLVSFYHWHYRKHPAPPTFSEVLRMLDENDPQISRARWESWALYTKEDRPAVDFVGRQETFFDDMRTVCHRIGIPFDETLITHEKPFAQAPHYHAMYGPGDRERVERIFSQEIERFGYHY